MRILYLHGFASGPQSRKAQFFEKRFAEHGVKIQVPRLDEGDFEALSITGQVNVIDHAVSINRDPVTIIGSSLGGYLAALYAVRHPQVERLVLLAPALRFPSRWRMRIPEDQMAQWKREGALMFFHYVAKQDRPLGYQFVEDANRYDNEPDFRQPALLIHGVHDTVVPADLSREFARRHSNVKLRLVESGHELTDVMDQLWTETAAFLGFQNS